MGTSRLTFFAFALFCALSLIHSTSSEASPPRLRDQKRDELAQRLLDVLVRAADAHADADADDVDDDDDDDESDDDGAGDSDTSAKIRRLIKLGKREPFFGGFLSGLTNGLATLAQNTAGALGLPTPGQDRGKGGHRPRPSATQAPAILPALAGAAGTGLSSLLNGLVNGGGGGGGGGGASGGMVFPSQPQPPAIPSGVVTISPPAGGSGAGSGAGDWFPAPMTRPDIDPISGVNITCPILHTFRLENCGKTQDSCSLDGSFACKRGSICCPTMNCNLQCVFPEDRSPRRGRCPVLSRPAIEHALFSGVIEPQSCYFDDHCPSNFKCCGPLPLGPGGEPRRYYKGARQVGTVGGGGAVELEMKLCFPAENGKKPIG